MVVHPYFLPIEPVEARIYTIVAKVDDAAGLRHPGVTL